MTMTIGYHIILFLTDIFLLRFIRRSVFAAVCLLLSGMLSAVPVAAQENKPADTKTYLDEFKTQLQKTFPKNRILNLVFHGHSVPAGYFKTPDVRPFSAYPLATLREIKNIYPTATVNVINTSIGGEHSESGAKRFEHGVLSHRPDVLFIDYALNDRSIGLPRAKQAWETMIEKALKQNISVILLTPTPDWSVDILDDNTPLAQHAEQIRGLAAKYKTGLADSYAAFKEKVKNGDDVKKYLSQINHPNETGHQMVTDLIMQFFIP